MDKNKKIKVLIVDTNKEFCNNLESYLNKEYDIEVVGIAFNGLDGYNKIIKLKPDIVLIDQVMPYLDGLGILEKLIESNIYHTQCIMITSISGSAKDYLMISAFNLGLKYYISKPFNNQYLVSRIRELCKAPTNIIQINNHKHSNIDLEIEVTNILHNLGIPAHIKGYSYLREALIITIQDMNTLDSVTKILYPIIAKQFNTTPARVERSIRHAIEVGWSRGEVEFINTLFGYTINKDRGRPTNSEFIALISDKLRLQMKVLGFESCKL